jgi:type IV pilus assembly protein PilA
MLRKLRERAQAEQGFTLIELLVVILIIGILAAIAIPSFINQRTKGQDAKAKTAVTTAAEAIETYATDNNGKYTGVTVAEIKNIEPTLNDATGLVIPATVGTPAAVSDTSYSVQVDSDSGSAGGGKFAVSKSAGVTTRACQNASKGGCKSDGSW